MLCKGNVHVVVGGGINVRGDHDPAGVSETYLASFQGAKGQPWGLSCMLDAPTLDRDTAGFTCDVN